MSDRTGMSEGEPRSPRTVWEHCLVWADLVLGAHVRGCGRLSAEEEAVLAGADRPLTVVVLAAAIHAHARARRVDEARVVEQVPLREPGPDGPGGIAGVLHRAPYRALEEAPEVAGCGKDEGERLLVAGTQGHPDGRMLWDRVRTAAVAAVEGAAVVAGYGQDGGDVVTLDDVRAIEARAWRLAALEDALGAADFEI
jgi:hypothetical protein